MRRHTVHRKEGDQPVKDRYGDYLKTVEQLLDYLPKKSKSKDKYLAILSDKNLSKKDALAEIKKIAAKAKDKRDSPAKTFTVKKYNEISTRVHQAILSINPAEDIQNSNLFKEANKISHEEYERLTKTKATR